MPRRLAAHAPRRLPRPRGALVLAALITLTLLRPAGADVILLKNGGRLEGVIVKETETTVQIRIRGGELTIKRSKIRKIQRKSEDANEALKKRQESEEEDIAATDKTRKPKAPATPKDDAAAEPLPDLRGKLGETVKVHDGRSRFSLKLPGGWKREGESGETVVALRPGPTGRLDITLQTTRGQSLQQLAPRLAKQIGKNATGFKELERSLTTTRSGAGRFLLIYELERGKQRLVAMSAWLDSGRPFKYAISFLVPKELYKDVKKALERSLESFTPVL